MPQTGQMTPSGTDGAGDPEFNPETVFAADVLPTFCRGTCGETGAFEVMREAEVDDELLKEDCA